MAVDQKRVNWLIADRVEIDFVNRIIHHNVAVINNFYQELLVANTGDIFHLHALQWNRSWVSTVEASRRLISGEAVPSG